MFLVKIIGGTTFSKKKFFLDLYTLKNGLKNIIKNTIKNIIKNLQKNLLNNL